MNGQLKEYVNKNYKNYKTDLFSVFMYRNFELCKPNGYSGFMTPFVWMFIKSYEKLRKYIIDNKSIGTLAQMEYSAFEEATVPICAFVLKNGRESNNGLYFRLSEFTGGMKVQKEKVLEAIENPDCGYFYETSKDNFAKIPGMPIAYWASENIIRDYEKSKLIGDYAVARNGIKTGQNGRFLRLWWEIVEEKLNTTAINYDEAKNSGNKWYVYNKGGSYRKWYGNNDYVVNWENCGYEIFALAKQDKRNVQDYPHEMKFIPTISWSLITSGQPAFRYKVHNLSDIAGMSLFTNKEHIENYLGLLNSKIALKILNLIAPTINFQAGDIARIPVVDEVIENNIVRKIVANNITLSKLDWDMHETSWDFEKSPLLSNKMDGKIKTAYESYKGEVNERFAKLKENEEELIVYL
jgi:hypothetical protein